MPCVHIGLSDNPSEEKKPTDGNERETDVEGKKCEGNSVPFVGAGVVSTAILPAVDGRAKEEPGLELGGGVLLELEEARGANHATPGTAN